jgi:hypothetical protein
LGSIVIAHCSKKRIETGLFSDVEKVEIKRPEINTTLRAEANLSSCASGLARPLTQAGIFVF